VQYHLMFHFSALDNTLLMLESIFWVIGIKYFIKP